VNNVFYDKYLATEYNTLYYTVFRLKAAGDDDSNGFNALIELEDTRGADKSTGNEADRQDVGNLFDPWWPLTEKEAMKTVEKDEPDPLDKTYIRSVNRPWSKDHAAVCRHNDSGGVVRIGALGRYYCDRKIRPGNNQCGKVSYTPKELKAEKTRLLNERDKIEAKGGKKMKQLVADINKIIDSLDEPYQCAPCTRLQHSLQPNGEFRPLTRRRMVYLFVFDCNDQDSYMEALRRIGEFQEALAKKGVTKARPMVYLVANKIDKDPIGWPNSSIHAHMKDYCQSNSVNQAEVSALQYKGIKKLFRTIIQDLKLRQPLWKLDPLTKDGDGEEGEDGEKCSVQ